MRKESHNLVEVIEFVKVHGLSAHAEIVGRWLWLGFPDKPPADVREAIKAYGFRWIRKRGRWAHNCGHPSRGGVGDPRNKYHVVRVDEIQNDSLVGAA
jgi:hypothetical protein